mgnify:CR=1 FL=1
MGFLDEPLLWMQTEKYVLPVLIVVQLWLSLGTGFLSFIAEKVGNNGRPRIVYGRIPGKLYGDIRHRKRLRDLHNRTKH